jgi:DNA invertase Pin-like site-specific DNA recombinase
MRGRQRKAVSQDAQLVSEVAFGKAGIVMGLEVSRLARNSADWHRLIELCALTATLILDEDGVYDPAGFNDRLLLGLKGTMSEAELHILKARMRGGQLNKARRGELAMGPPVGLVYRTDGTIGLDPDAALNWNAWPASSESAPSLIRITAKLMNVPDMGRAERQ